MAFSLIFVAAQSFTILFFQGGVGADCGVHAVACESVGRGYESLDRLDFNLDLRRLMILFCGGLLSASIFRTKLYGIYASCPLVMIMILNTKPSPSDIQLQLIE